MKKMTREDQIDKLIAAYFDRLWANPMYLNMMGKNLRQLFTLRQEWNKQMEMLWQFLQLPNQNMQQRMMHQLNTLTSESRFEQEEVQDRLSQMESELAEIKALLIAQQTQADTETKTEARKESADASAKGNKKSTGKSTSKKDTAKS